MIEQQVFKTTFAKFKIMRIRMKIGYMAFLNNMTV